LGAVCQAMSYQSDRRIFYEVYEPPEDSAVLSPYRPPDGVKSNRVMYWMGPIKRQ